MFPGTGLKVCMVVVNGWVLKPILHFGPNLCLRLLDWAWAKPNNQKRKKMKMTTRQFWAVFCVLIMEAIFKNVIASFIILYNVIWGFLVRVSYISLQCKCSCLQPSIGPSEVHAPHVWRCKCGGQIVATKITMKTTYPPALLHISSGIASLILQYCFTYPPESLYIPPELLQTSSRIALHILQKQLTYPPEPLHISSFY